MSKLNGNVGWVINLVSLIVLAISGTVWLSDQFHDIELYHSEVRHSLGDRWRGSDQIIWTMRLEKTLERDLPDPLRIIRQRTNRYEVPK